MKGISSISMAVLLWVTWGLMADSPMWPVEGTSCGMMGPDPTYITHNISFVGNWPFGPSEAITVDLDRNLVFLGSGGGVLILDVTNLSNPQKVSDKIRTRGRVNDIAYDRQRRRLYIATYEAGIEIWDVNNPSNPEFLSRIVQEHEYFTSIFLTGTSYLQWVPMFTYPYLALQIHRILRG